ncbi:hypothetical protein GH825_30780, partial [Bacillus thuringiensis]|nr:hypothetical protein [Bacillus thuringiensis]
KSTARPSEKDIKKILSSVGIDADDACLKKVISELKGKNVVDVMAAGREKLTSVPAGHGRNGTSGDGPRPFCMKEISQANV